jgi:CubicO group peptidase (beta-lactamase class C family)
VTPLLVGMVLERATGRTVSAYLEEKLWGPLGMEADGSWSLDSRTDPSPRFQYYWWTRPGAGARTDFWGQGSHGQFIYVAPERDLVLVRFGTDCNYDHWLELLAELARRL